MAAEAPRALGPPVQLTQLNAGHNYAPAWAPDGGELLFLSRRQGFGWPALFRIAAAGGPDRAVSLAESMYVGGPAWSPDGGRFAFPGFTPDSPNWHLFVADLESGAFHPLVQLRGGAVRGVSWAPDGDSIVYAELSATRPGAEAGETPDDQDSGGSAPQWILRIIPATGGSAREIATVEHCSGAAWSHRGDVVAVAAGQRILLVPVDGGPPRTLLEHPGAQLATPSWSPNDRYIAYIVALPEGGGAELRAVPADGGESILLWAATGELPTLGGATWSPDGRHIAFDVHYGFEYHYWTLELDPGR